MREVVGHRVRLIARIALPAVLACLLAGSPALANPGVFGAAYGTPTVPNTVVATATFQVSVSLTNTGDEPWTTGGSNPVNLSYHWYDPSGTPQVWEGARTFIGSIPVVPLAKITVNANVLAPTTAGQYTLRFALVKEGVTWFEPGAPALVTVQPAILTASYVAQTPPQAAPAGNAIQIAVALTNNGNQTWSVAGSNPVNLTYHWYDATGNTVISWDGLHTARRGHRTRRDGDREREGRDAADRRHVHAHRRSRPRRHRLARRHRRKPAAPRAAHRRHRALRGVVWHSAAARHVLGRAEDALGADHEHRQPDVERRGAEPGERQLPHLRLGGAGRAVGWPAHRARRGHGAGHRARVHRRLHRAVGIRDLYARVRSRARRRRLVRRQRRTTGAPAVQRDERAQRRLRHDDDARAGHDRRDRRPQRQRHQLQRQDVAGRGREPGAPRLPHHRREQRHDIRVGRRARYAADRREARHADHRADARAAPREHRRLHPRVGPRAGRCRVVQPGERPDEERAVHRRLRRRLLRQRLRPRRRHEPVRRERSRVRRDRTSVHRRADRRAVLPRHDAAVRRCGASIQPRVALAAVIAVALPLRYEPILRRLLRRRHLQRRLPRAR